MQTGTDNYATMSTTATFHPGPNETPMHLHGDFEIINGTMQPRDGDWSNVHLDLDAYRVDRA